MQICSIGGDVRPNDSECCNGQIHACYSQAAHAKLDDGRLLTLTQDEAQLGMRVLCFSAQNWAQMHTRLRPGQPIKLSHQAFLLHDISYDLSRSTCWQSPDVRHGFPETLSQNLITHANDWLARAFRTSQNGHLWQAAWLRFAACLKALRDETKPLAQAVQATMGLGPGLTPSGDDLLCGLLLGTGASGNCLAFHRLHAAIQLHLEDVPLPSRDAFEQASRGWVTARLQAVLSSLCAGGSTTALDLALSEQASTGHHSGLDTLLGLFSGLNFPFVPTFNERFS